MTMIRLIRKILMMMTMMMMMALKMIFLTYKFRYTQLKSKKRSV